MEPGERGERMSTKYLIGIALAGMIVLGACMAATIVVVGLVQDVTAPRGAATDATADAAVTIDNRCVFASCSVTVSLDQQQETSAQATEDKPGAEMDFPWLLVGGSLLALALWFVFVFPRPWSDYGA